MYHEAKSNDPASSSEGIFWEIPLDVIPKWNTVGKHFCVFFIIYFVGHAIVSVT